MEQKIEIFNTWHWEGFTPNHLLQLLTLEGFDRSRNGLLTLLWLRISFSKNGKIH